MASLKGVFDFEKDVEYSFNFDKDIISSNGFNNSALILEPGLMEERDSDFYEDDLEDMSDTAVAESAVRAGVYPGHSVGKRRNSDDYDYEYQVEEKEYNDHGGSYGGGYDSGYKVQPKKPGPYGYATPNFKCKKTSETLYVTKTEITYDKKCYNVYKVQCTEGYDEGKV